MSNNPLDEAIGQYVSRGWDIHQATPTGVQLKHPSGRSVYLTAEMAQRGERPDLELELPVPATVPKPEAEENLFKYVISQYTSAGWQVEDRFENSINLVKPRKWNQLGLLLFVLIPLLVSLVNPLALGVAVFGLLFVAVDYLLKADKHIHITAQEVRDEAVPEPPNPTSTWSTPLIVSLVLVGVFLIWVISFFLR